MRAGAGQTPPFWRPLTGRSFPMALPRRLKGYPGHPSHPPLTGVSIGAYTVAAALLVLGTLGLQEPAMAHGALLAISAGLILAPPTMLTGLLDRRDLPPERQSASWRTCIWSPCWQRPPSSPPAGSPAGRDTKTAASTLPPLSSRWSVRRFCSPAATSAARWSTSTAIACSLSRRYRLARRYGRGTSARGRNPSNPCRPDRQPAAPRKDI